MPVGRVNNVPEILRALNAGNPRFAGVIQSGLANTPKNNFDTLLPFTLPKGALVQLQGTTDIYIESVALPTDRARRYTNELPQSESIDNASWTKSAFGGAAAIVVTPNDGVAPDGSLTADKVDFAVLTAGGQQIFLNGLVPSPVARTIVASVWCKKTGAGTGTFFLQLFDGGGLNNALEIDPAVTWTRYVVAGLMVTLGAAAFPQLKLIHTFQSIAAKDDAVSFHVWGMQLEEVPAGSIATGPYPIGFVGTQPAQGPYLPTVAAVATTGKGMFLNAGQVGRMFLDPAHEYVSVIPVNPASVLAPVSVHVVD